MNIHKELPLSFPGCPPSPDPSPPFTQISRHYLDKPAVMFTKGSQPACLGSHRGVPHVRSIHGNNEIEPAILLEHRENQRILPDGRWHPLISTLHFRFVSGIKTILKAGLVEELSDTPQIRYRDRWLHFPKGYESLHICLKDRPLFPATKRQASVPSHQEIGQREHTR